MAKQHIGIIVFGGDYLFGASPILGNLHMWKMFKHLLLFEHTSHAYLFQAEIYAGVDFTLQKTRKPDQSSNYSHRVRPPITISYVGEHDNKQSIIYTCIYIYMVYRVYIELLHEWGFKTNF